MNKSEFKEKWDIVLRKLSDVMEPIKVSTFFRPLLPYKVGESEGVLYFYIAQQSNVNFYKNMVQKNLSDLLPIVENVFGKSYTISILDNEPEENEENEESADDSRLNPTYTFDTFVAGPSNQLAHAVSLAVAEGYSKSYNPLFLYGGSGLGKTHLMHAIGQYVLKSNHKKRVLYVSSEMFTNELISSIKNQGSAPEKFRNKYRKVDYLLFDDVQFIAGKERTVEELFNTFEALYSAGKQVVFTSDRAPKDLGDIPERLVQRFSCGIAVDIQPPDYETRMAILQNKAILSGINPNDDDISSVLDVIAQNIQGNIRDLEGAFNRIIAHSKLMNENITRDFAKKVLSDVFNTRTKAITPSFIKETVADYFGIKVSEMESSKRQRNIAYPRQIAIYLIRENTNYSFPNIGDFFGGRDHTTILHSYEKIKTDMENSKELADTINNLDRILNE